eukprot:s1350_g3.t1
MNSELRFLRAIAGSSFFGTRWASWPRNFKGCSESLQSIFTPTTQAPANCAPKNFDIGQDLDQSWRQGLSQQIADRSPMAGMQRPDATQGYMMEGGVVPAMPGHFVLMPAMHLSPPVMWDRTTPYSPSGKELEEMLRKAMPTHYDD